MTDQAAADPNPSVQGDGLRAKLPPWHILAQQVRLWSGLILLGFCLTHFLGHALGNISYASMNWSQSIRWAIWQSTLGTAALYGALIIHGILALTKTLSRRTFKLPWSEWVQLSLGLAIPYFLISHIMFTRVGEEALNVSATYRHVISSMWTDAIISQTVLLLIVWVHAMIGLHIWLRHRKWYRVAAPWLLVLAVAVPVLATTGWTNAAKELALRDRIKTNYKEGQQETLTLWTDRARIAGFTILGFVVLYPVSLSIYRRYKASLAITYLGDKAVRAAPGPTLLEISRENGIPHVSICGGRARCSTCRVRIIKGLETLEPASASEKAVLAHVKAGEDVRLACQLRPHQNLTVSRLVRPQVEETPAEGDEDTYRWGVEQPVIVMFTDLRGFTRFSEKRLPYDVVFVLNAYLESSARTIEQNHGRVDKFMGDGIMALFGVGRTFDEASRDALSAAVALQEGIDHLNEELTQHIDDPLRLAIAVHGGPAILGRIGDSRGDGPLTALGDTVNTASRLEGVVKQKNARIVASDAVMQGAQVDIASVGEADKVEIRGRESAESIAVIYDIDRLKSLLG